MNDDENIFDGIMPEDCLLAGPWIGCMKFCLSNSEILERFRKETGNNWTPRHGITAMVDKACGVDKEFFQQFAKWMNENIWGEVDSKELISPLDSS